MLILTGITINLLFGDNGLITKTKMAKKAFLGDDAREVVEDRVNAYLAEYGTKKDLSLYDFWFMYNSHELEDGVTLNPNYDPNFVIYLFEDVGVAFTPSVQAYTKKDTYTSAVVIYKGYSVTLDAKLSVKGKATAIEDLTETQISRLENQQIYTISPTGWAYQKTIIPGGLGTSKLWTDVSGSMQEVGSGGVTVTANGTYNYEVRPSGGGSLIADGTIEIDKIDRTKPVVTTNSFKATLNGSNVNLEIKVTDSESGFGSVNFYHKTEGGSYTGLTAGVGGTAGETTEQTVTATLTNLSEGTYTIKAVVKDGTNSNENTYETEIGEIVVEGPTADVTQFGPGKINTSSTYVGKTVTNYVPQTSSFKIPEYEGIAISGNSTESLTWKVLSEDNEGNLLITTTTPTSATIEIGNIGDGQDNDKYARAAAGYNNAVQALNAYCRKYYSKGSNILARNLNMEDLEAHLTDDGTTARDGYTNYNSTITPSSKDYAPAGYSLEIAQTNPKGRSFSPASSSYGQYTATLANNLLTSRPSSYKSTYYYFSNSNIITNDYFDATTESILFSSGAYGSGFWLSSRCVGVDSGNASFRVRYVSSGGGLSAGRVLYSSGGGVDSPSFAFRPAVTIPQSEIGNYTFTN